jgi:hypothetical protein
VPLNELVIFIEHRCIPALWHYPHQAFFSHCDIAMTNKAKTLNNPQMVSIETQRSPAEHAEVNDCTAGLRADPRELFQPCANFVCSVARQKIQR